jgi:phage FluMu protein gp41
VKTEFDFTLPRGYVDGAGQVHRQGVMRLAMARDEVEPLEDPRVTANPAYVSITLLSRVITRLGSISPVTPAVIQGLFASDFAYLQEMYLRLNESDHQVETQCPSCGTRFAIDLMSENDA